MAKKKELTRDQANSRFQRAITAARDLRGDDELAAGIESAGLEAWLESKGYTLKSNPIRLKGRKNNMAKSKIEVETEDTIRDIYDLTQEAGSTRAEMESTLDQIADLCTDAIPDLDPENSDDGDDEIES